MNKLLSSLFVGLCFFLILFGSTDINLNTSIALAFSVFIFSLFILGLGNTVPIIELMIFISCVQWIVGPFISYTTKGGTLTKYYMSIPENTYMPFMLLSIGAYFIGSMVFYRPIQKIQVDIDKEAKKYVVANSNMPFLLIAFGLLSHVFVGLVPVSLRFIFNLLDGMQFIGVYYLFISESRFKWQFLAFVVSLNFFISISMGFFHNLLIWLTFSFIYINRVFRLGFLTNVFLICSGFYFIYLLQGIKGEYRNVIWESNAYSNEEVENTKVFGEMMAEKIQEDNIEDLTFLEIINTRINQGWIISRIMYYVPANEPFAEGETVKTAIEASLLPRFLSPDKKKAGGKENYERFTGFELEETSMGISLVGEAYANYGMNGTYIFMFSWGVLIGFVLMFIFKMSATYPTIWLWIPLMFAHVIKAETELVVVLNYLTKSLFLVFILYWSLNRFFGIRL